MLRAQMETMSEQLHRALGILWYNYGSTQIGFSTTLVGYLFVFVMNKKQLLGDSHMLNLLLIKQVLTCNSA